MKKYKPDYPSSFAQAIETLKELQVDADDSERGCGLRFGLQLGIDQLRHLRRNVNAKRRKVCAAEQAKEGK